MLSWSVWPTPMGFGMATIVHVVEMAVFALTTDGNGLTAKPTINSENRKIVVFILAMPFHLVSNLLVDPKSVIVKIY